MLRSKKNQKELRAFVFILLIVSIAILIATSKKNINKVQGLEIARGGDDRNITASPRPAVKVDTVTGATPKGVENEVELKRKPEASGKPETVTLKPVDDKFEISTKDASATSNFPLSVNKTTGQIFVNTGDGTKEIRILPDQASQVAKSAGVINEINKIEVEKDNSGNTVLTTTGKRNGKILGIIPFETDVKVSVNSQTGQVENVQEPAWVKLFSFLIK